MSLMQKSGCGCLKASVSNVLKSDMDLDWCETHLTKEDDFPDS